MKGVAMMLARGEKYLAMRGYGNDISDGLGKEEEERGIGRGERKKK